MLLLAGAQILGGYVHNAVGVNVKGNLDLRDSSSRRRNSIQTELAQGLVVSGELALALYHVNINSGLIVGRGGEDLALLGGDGGVALDQSGRYAAHGLDGQGQGGNV